jgi:hypothetical protein
VVKNLDKKVKQREGKADKSRQIRQRAGELAMNQGKRAHEAGEKEMQRAKRELLDLEITSPQG